MNLHFGIDADLFKPLNFSREDKLLHVGMIGTLNNPRRFTKPIIEAVGKLPGVRLMLFPTHMFNQHDVDLLGGKQILQYVESGELSWPGLVNAYNRLDVLIRCDIDPGYSFPVLEAAACGVPVIATNSGIDHFITNQGGGLLIGADETDNNGSGRAWYQSHESELLWEIVAAVEYLRDNPKDRKEMGKNGREEIVKNWDWGQFIPVWEEFFQDGINRALKNA